jgi:hypothetical protein
MNAIHPFHENNETGDFGSAAAGGTPLAKGRSAMSFRQPA